MLKISWFVWSVSLFLLLVLFSNLNIRGKNHKKMRRKQKCVKLQVPSVVVAFDCICTAIVETRRDETPPPLPRSQVTPLSSVCTSRLCLKLGLFRVRAYPSVACFIIWRRLATISRPQSPVSISLADSNQGYPSLYIEQDPVSTLHVVVYSIRRARNKSQGEKRPPKVCRDAALLLAKIERLREYVNTVQSLMIRIACGLM